MLLDEVIINYMNVQKKNTNCSACSANCHSLKMTVESQLIEAAEVSV